MCVCLLFAQCMCVCVFDQCIVGRRGEERVCHTVCVGVRGGVCVWVLGMHVRVLVHVCRYVGG